MSTGTELHDHRTAAASPVPEGVKLHMFECGTLKCHVENIKMNQGLGEEYELPVPWEEKALPGFLASAVDTVRPVKKLRRIARRSGAAVVTGHDPDEGLEPGQRLALYLQNVPQFVMAMIATWKAGAIVVSVSPMLKHKELTAQLVDSEATALITLESLWTAIARDVVAETPVRTVITRQRRRLPPTACRSGRVRRSIPTPGRSRSGCRSAIPSSASSTTMATRSNPATSVNSSRPALRSSPATGSSRRRVSTRSQAAGFTPETLASWTSGAGLLTRLSSSTRASIRRNPGSGPAAG